MTQDHNTKFEGGRHQTSKYVKENKQMNKEFT